MKVNEEGWNATLSFFVDDETTGVTEILSEGADESAKAKTYWVLDAPVEVYFDKSPNTLVGIFEYVNFLQQVVSVSVLVASTSTRLFPIPRDVST